MDDIEKGKGTRVVGVIPARYSSTRFPGKPLAQILGKTLIEHVYTRAKKATSISELVVATDDERILHHCESLRIPVIMTSDKHQTGTDRVCEVAMKMNAQAFVNIQGDEPLISSEAIDNLVFTALKNEARVATLVTLLDEADEAITNPNVVKVVLDRQGFALYFSRSPIPYQRIKGYSNYYQHIGVYFFQRVSLLEFSRLPQGRLEKTEGLEQLRYLENKIPILAVETDYRPVAVDTPKDIEKVEAILLDDG